MPADLPVRLIFRPSALLDLAAIVPDVEPSASQPAPSLAVQVSDVVPLLVSVTDALVAVRPKSTLTGETERVEGTIIETGILADPAVPPEKWM